MPPPDVTAVRLASLSEAALLASASIFGNRSSSAFTLPSNRSASILSLFALPSTSFLSDAIIFDNRSWSAFPLASTSFSTFATVFRSTSAFVIASSRQASTRNASTSLWFLSLAKSKAVLPSYFHQSYISGIVHKKFEK